MLPDMLRYKLLSLTLHLQYSRRCLKLWLGCFVAFYWQCMWCTEAVCCVIWRVFLYAALFIWSHPASCYGNETDTSANCWGDLVDHWNCFISNRSRHGDILAHFYESLVDSSNTKDTHRHTREIHAQKRAKQSGFFFFFFIYIQRGSLKCSLH